MVPLFICNSISHIKVIKKFYIFVKWSFESLMLLKQTNRNYIFFSYEKSFILFISFPGLFSFLSPAYSISFTVFKFFPCRFSFIRILTFSLNFRNTETKISRRFPWITYLLCEKCLTTRDNRYPDEIALLLLLTFFFV